MKRYTEIVCIAGPVLGTVKRETGGASFASAVSDVKPFVINKYLKEGYELIEIKTHASPNHDKTATMFILGKQRKQEKKK